MANGFAMRGFTQGLTQGLQNANDLYNSYVNRDLQRAESERLRKGQETQDRWYEAQARNQEMDNARQERMLKLNEQKGEREITKSDLDIAKDRLAMEQANKQAQFPVIEAILKKNSLSPDEYQKLDAFGMGPILNMEDDADTIDNLAKGVRSGEIPMDDPEVVKRLLPALTPTLNRNLGDVGYDPQYKEKITVAVKRPIGLQRINGKVVPVLHVQGANANGDFREYDAPATQFASSLPDDPLLALSESAVARKLSGLAKFQRNLSKNPDLRQQAQEFARSLAYGAPKPLTAEQQAKADYYGEKRNTERYTQLEKAQQAAKLQLEGLLKEKELGGFDSRRGLEDQVKNAELKLKGIEAQLKQEQITTQQSMQDRNYAAADYTDSRRSGLGSAGRTKEATFNRDKAMKRAGDIYRAPPKGMAGIPDSPEVEKERQAATVRQNQFVDTVESLVTKKGLRQDQAEIAAREGQPIKNVKAPDGRVFNGWRAQIDGKWVNIPFEWVN